MRNCNLAEIAKDAVKIQVDFGLELSEIFLEVSEIDLD